MKPISITFGRFNPPTLGHELVFKCLTRNPEYSHRIFLSQTQNKDNPLSFERKIYWIKKLYPGYNLSIKKKVRTIFDALESVIEQDYDDVELVVGGDRSQEMYSFITKYMNHDDHKYLHKLKSFEVVSAGNRVPDAQDISGISGTKAREACRNGNVEAFNKYFPGERISAKELFEFYNEVRRGMDY